MFAYIVYKMNKKPDSPAKNPYKIAEIKLKMKDGVDAGFNKVYK